ncbi:MAG: phage DNA encapsidation protein, partial [Pauljensenia sp.]|nr:phage DNA encapsidation protein [Pauljensenia sp.]
RWEFPGVDLSVKGKVAYLGGAKGGTPIGQVVYLSAAQMLKSVSLKRVKHIIFDEFILEKGATHYLPDEASVFEGLYSTVDRWDDRVRVYFLANAFSLTNPYYVKYGIVPTAEFTVEPGADRFWAVHTDRSEEFAEQVSKTKFGAFLRRQDDENSRYMIDSSFRDEGAEMVEAKPSSAVYSLTIVGGSRPLSFWLGRDWATWYATEGATKAPNLYTLDPRRVDEATRLLQPRDPYMKNIRDSYARGRVRFDKLTTRNLFVKEVYKGL